MTINYFNLLEQFNETHSTKKAWKKWFIIFFGLSVSLVLVLGFLSWVSDDFNNWFKGFYATSKGYLYGGLGLAFLVSAGRTVEIDEEYQKAIELYHKMLYQYQGFADPIVKDVTMIAYPVILDYRVNGKSVKKNIATYFWMDSHHLFFLIQPPITVLKEEDLFFLSIPIDTLKDYDYYDNPTLENQTRNRKNDFQYEKTKTRLRFNSSENQCSDLIFDQYFFSQLKQHLSEELLDQQKMYRVVREKIHTHVRSKLPLSIKLGELDDLLRQGSISEIEYRQRKNQLLQEESR